MVSDNHYVILKMITLSCNLIDGSSQFKRHESNDTKDDKSGKKSCQNVTSCNNYSIPTL